MNRSAFLVPAMLALLAGQATAQCLPTFPKFTSGAGAVAHDQLGLSVAFSFGGGNFTPLMVVGKPNADSGANVELGGFIAYRKDSNGNWVQMQEFVNTGGAVGERLGASIDLADPYVICGAPGYNNYLGRARILTRSGGGLSYASPITLAPSIADAGSEFGSSVAIDNHGGGWALVGAPHHQFLGGGQYGAVFGYTRSAAGTWSQAFVRWSSTLDNQVDQLRGQCVAIDGEWGAYGLPNRTLSGYSAGSGAVRMVRHAADGTIAEYGPELAPPTRNDAEQFGTSVAIAGDVMAIGSPGEDATIAEDGFAKANCGAVRIYRLENGEWTLWTTFRSPGPTDGAGFGEHVALAQNADGVRLVINEPNTRHVYSMQIYPGEPGGAWGYTAMKTMTDPDGPGLGSFGSAVGTNGVEIGVGDGSDDNNGQVNAGAVYLINGDTLPNLGDEPYGGEWIYDATVTGCTLGATATPYPVANCGAPSTQGNDIWFYFRARCSGNVTFDTVGSDFDTVISVHSSIPEPGQNYLVACNDDGNFAIPDNRASQVSFHFEGHADYYIRVSGYNGAAGSVVLRQQKTFDTPAPSNDSCAGAITVGYGVHAYENCSAAHGDVIPCLNSRIYNDVWYRWVAPHSGPVSMTTCGSNFSGALAIYEGGCPAAPGNTITCGSYNGECASNSAAVSFDAIEGTAYLVRVGGSLFTQEGQGVLNIIDTTPSCLADYNHDFGVDGDDVIAFFADWDAGQIAADVNTDGGVDGDDVIVFFEHWDAGC